MRLYATVSVKTDASHSRQGEQLASVLCVARRLDGVERADGLVAADATDRLSKELGHADDANLFTLL